jgi:hypothetical protein
MLSFGCIFALTTAYGALLYSAAQCSRLPSMRVDMNEIKADVAEVKSDVEEIKMKVAAIESRVARYR